MQREDSPSARNANLICAADRNAFDGNTIKIASFLIRDLTCELENSVIEQTDSALEAQS